MRQRTEHQQRSVAIEIAYDSLHICISDQREGEATRLRTESVLWRKEAVALDSETALQELTAALKRLVSTYKLHGQSVQFALSGDFCVTRVVTGKSEDVRQQLHELEERSSSYFLLGHGPKTLGRSVRDVDAKHQHALLSIVNPRSLTTVMDAVTRAGLKSDVVEPSIVATCRLLGYLGGDHDEPALVIQVGQRTVELGVSHRGQMLLDYRPSGHDVRTSVADIVARHLVRLQRYCDRYVQFAEGQISRVYLVGDKETVLALTKDFAERTELQATVLDREYCVSHSDLAIESSTVETIAAMGTCIRPLAEEAQQITPNLLERVRSYSREPLLPALARTLWPVAAAVAIAGMTWAFALYEYRNCCALEAQLETFEPQLQQARLLRMRLIDRRTKVQHLVAIQSALDGTPWHTITQTIGQCLPDDVWLQSMSVDRERRITILGAALTEDGVFELVGHLRKYPAIERVALQGTEVARFRAGPVTQFSIQCEVRDYDEESDYVGQPG